MAALKKQDLRRTFSGKCKAEEDTKGDHVWYVFRVGDAVYAKTKVSHGRGDLGRPIAARIARQVGLTQDELRELVSCNYTSANFHANLAASGPFTGTSL